MNWKRWMDSICSSLTSIFSCFLLWWSYGYPNLHDGFLLVCLFALCWLPWNREILLGKSRRCSPKRFAVRLTSHQENGPAGLDETGRLVWLYMGRAVANWLLNAKLILLDLLPTVCFGFWWSRSDAEHILKVGNHWRRWTHSCSVSTSDNSN